MHTMVHKQAAELPKSYSQASEFGTHTIDFIECQAFEACEQARGKEKSIEIKLFMLVDFRIDQTISIVHWIRFRNRNGMEYVICVVFHRKSLRMLTCLTNVNNVCNVPLCKINISFITVKMPDQQRVMVGTNLTVRYAVRSASICVNFK